MHKQFVDEALLILNSEAELRKIHTFNIPSTYFASHLELRVRDWVILRPVFKVPASEASASGA